MLKYYGKRILLVILTVFIVASITFFLVHLIPGDPLDVAARKLPDQIRANFYAKYGLDLPLYQQYGLFVKNLAHGDLGDSMVNAGRSVGDTIKRAAPISGRIGIQAVFLGFFVGLTLGIIAAFNRNRWPDYIVMILAILGVSIPSFVMAALLQYFLTVKIQILPTTWTSGGFKDTILPTLALCFGSIATYARYMRSSVLEITGQDYVLTAKSKGVSSFAMVVKHILRNAILPAITILGPQLAGIFVGSFVIETIFSIPGFGQIYTMSIQNKDYSMVMGQTVVFTTMLIFSYLLVDILYGLANPRIIKISRIK
jgi:oligopeptide transport system permease protein